MKVLLDNVLVKLFSDDIVTKGGIILEYDVWNNLQKGEVIKVGNGHRLKNGKIKKLDVNEGDYVVFKRDNFRKTIKVDNIDCQVLKEHEILCIIDDINISIVGKDDVPN